MCCCGENIPSKGVANGHAKEWGHFIASKQKRAMTAAVTLVMHQTMCALVIIIIFHKREFRLQSRWVVCLHFHLSNIPVYNASHLTPASSHPKIPIVKALELLWIVRHYLVLTSVSSNFSSLEPPPSSPPPARSREQCPTPSLAHNLPDDKVYKLCRKSAAQETPNCKSWDGL